MADQKPLQPADVVRQMLLIHQSPTFPVGLNLMQINQFEDYAPATRRIILKSWGIHKSMKYDDIESFVEQCRSSHRSQIRWCDRKRFIEENAAGTSPGGDLNPFGYYVIGTTIGGNAVVASEADKRICFADHTWYCGDEINSMLDEID